MNFVVDQIYNRYYSLWGYIFDDVRESGWIIMWNGGFLSLNLLVFLGVNDMENELMVLEEFIEDIGVDMIQMWNFNVDLEFYIVLLGIDGFGLGIGFLVRKLMFGPKSSVFSNVI